MNGFLTKNIIAIKYLCVILVIGIAFVFSQKVSAECWCNWSFCGTPGGGCNIFVPYHFHGQEFFGTCANPGGFCKYYEGNYHDNWVIDIPCSNCPYGYGDDSNYNYFQQCITSCGAGGGDPPLPPGCNYGTVTPYTCVDEGNEGNLRLQFWHLDGFPAWGAPRGLAYSDIAGYSVYSPKRPSNFCPYWYGLTWTGYIYIPAGQREFTMITRCDSQPGHYDCADWVSRIYLGYVNSGGTLIPGGYITEGTGQPGGSFHNILVGDPVDHSFSGNFGGGWYPIFVSYLQPENNGDEYPNQGPGLIELYWRTGANPYVRVPANASTYRPCTAPAPTNNDPTAQISARQGGAYQLGPGPVYVRRNNSMSFEIVAQDTDSNLNTINLFRRGWDPIPNPPVLGDTPSPIGGTVSCLTHPSSCTREMGWTPDTAGWYVVYPNVEDTAGGRCTGRPYTPSGWADCDPVNIEANDIDNVKVYVNDPPVCSAIRGPNQAPPDSVRFYNVQASDANSHLVRMYNWTASGGQFVPIQRIRIRARGDQYLGSPVMKVVRGNPSTGNHTQPCTFTVGNNWGIFTCELGGVNVSSLALIFDNDLYGGPGMDRNLHVDYVEYDYISGGVTWTVTVQAEARETNGSYVIYDVGLGAAAFDGIDVDPAGTVLSDRVLMAFNGALKLPILWRAPSTTGSRTLSVSTQDDHHTGGTCSLSVNVCGVAPSPAPVLQTPPNNDSIDIGLTPTINFTWTGVSSWGNSCTTLTRSYEVWIKRPSDADFFRYDPCTRVGTNPATSCAVDSQTAMTAWGGDVPIQWRVRAANHATIRDSTTYVDSTPFTFTLSDPGEPWYTVIDNGDALSTSLGIRPPVNVNANWNPSWLVRGPQGAPFSTGNIDAVNISQSLRNVRYIPSDILNFWPKPQVYQTFNPPAGATLISNSSAFNNLNPNQVYYFTNPSFMGGTLNYNLSSDGVAVIYYTGGTDLTLNNNIRVSPANVNRRILLVTNRNVVVTSNPGIASPLPSSRPHIEMGIITGGNITFLGITGAQQGTDLSIIVEGPMIVGGELLFGRDRTLATNGNSYPTEIIRYNYRFLHRLTTQERNSPNPNYTGLFESKIIWEGEN
jgi:hypothetical protein